MLRRHLDTEPLERLDLFRNCSDGELRRATSLMTELRYPPARTLTRELEPGREFFVIREGWVRVLRDGQHVARLGAGGFFGEMALLDGGLRTATVTTEAPTLVYVLSSREFATLLQQCPTVARNMLQAMSERLRVAA